MDNITEKFPSKCWDCEFARRTWSIELENKGYVGFSYVLNPSLKTNRFIREKRLEDLFEVTDVEHIQEGWITQRRPLDRSENGGGSTFNLQPIMHSVKNCEIYEPKK